MGALRILTNATECLDGVGVGVRGGDGDVRMSAALISDGEIAPMLDTVRNEPISQHWFLQTRRVS